MLKVLIVIVVAIFAVVCYSDADKEIRLLLMETNLGNIEIELYPAVAPKIVANFIKLSEEGFYDGTYFHRVIPSFMIQGGDPNTKDGDRSTDGRGGPDYRINDEISAKALGLDTLLV